MTSTANLPTTNPALNSSSSTNAPSYASAAGASKKSSAAPPVIATGSSQVAPGVASPNATAQHGNSSSPPVNGSRSSNSTGAPAIVSGSSNMNGSSKDHGRNNSVTISGNAPGNFAANGGAVGNAKSKIQFGGLADSPAMQHSTPQNATSAPISIPRTNIPSPAQDPLPIPQPAMSGGKPMATDISLKIGSFTGDGDRQRPAPATQNSNMSLGADSGIDFRRNSSHSQSGDVNGHMGPNAGRGGMNPQAGRGRGYPPAYSNDNSLMGFPPPNAFSYPRGPTHHNAGRGGMPQQGYGRGGMSGYNGGQRGSPAPAHAQPSGTPTMGQAMPNPGYAPQFVPPMSGYQQPVNNPHPSRDSLVGGRGGKKRGSRESEKFQTRQPDSGRTPKFESSYKAQGRRLSKRGLSTSDADYGQGGHDSVERHGALPPFAANVPVHLFPPSLPPHHRYDLSPGNFEQVLTATKPQNFYGYDPMGRPGMGPNGQMMPMGMPSYPHQQHPSAYQNMPPNPQFFATPHYSPQPPHATAMTRNDSQMSERPASTVGQNQPPAIVSGTAHSVKPSTPSITSSDFQRPRKSAAIVIKDLSGKALDIRSIKAPASPAASIEKSKTPPIVTSTPTPPPPSTSVPPSETASRVGKSSDEVRNEFMKRVKESAGTGASTETKAEEVAPTEKAAVEKEASAPAPAAAAEKESVQEPEKAVAQTKPETKSESKPETKPETTPSADEKAVEEPVKKEEPKVEAAPPTPAEKKEDASAPAASTEETEEEAEERMIREMEEEDARREAAQAEMTAKKAAEKAAAKAKADKENTLSPEENDRKLREQEAEMERIEEEKEKARAAAEASGKPALSAKELLEGKSQPQSAEADSSSAAAEPLDSPTTTDMGPPSAKSVDRRLNKPAALNLSHLNTKAVEAPQPSAALQSLKSARFLSVRDDIKYPAGIASPNPALNAAVVKKGKAFRYDSAFLLQFQKVFTEQPSLEFGEQVKNLIGDSDGSRSAGSRQPAGSGSGRQSSSKGGVGNFGGAMGNYAQPSKPLGPNSTSAERFAASSKPGASRPGTAAMASFRGPPGSSFGGSQMSRVPSTTGMGMGAPNSPRQGSRRGGAGAAGGSKRAGYNPDDAKAAKTMPLTAGMALKPIAVTSSGWKPTNIGARANAAAAGPVPGGYLDPETVQRKVKAALNKMTPEKFEKIADQILIIAGQSKDEQDGRTLRQVIQLTFEKATDESHWASMYAKFCKRMHDMMNPEIKDVTIIDKQGVVVSGGALFRKYLLNRCQENFELGWKSNLPSAKEGESKEAVMLSDEYYEAEKAKRQGLGLIQFIGELYKLSMLTERIMYECVQRLLNFATPPDEAEVESLTKLIRTIGYNLDNSDKGRMHMDVYFDRINNVVNQEGLPSRLKFMLMDVVDLRKKNWEGKDVLKGPKTLEEIRADAEAAAAQKAAESARASQRNQGSGRGQMGGRGDSRNFPAYNQQPTNQVGMEDLRRLTSRNNTNRAASGATSTFGPSSMFSGGSRSNSGRRGMGPGGALSRGGDDSHSSSRNGTSATRESSNAFAALAMDPQENPTSPPSTAVSPALSKAAPAASSGEEKKE